MTGLGLPRKRVHAQTQKTQRRIWVEKAGAGEFDRDQEAADLLGAYEARIAALERLVGQQTLEIEFLKKAQKLARSRTSAASSATTVPPGSPSNGGAR